MPLLPLLGDVIVARQTPNEYSLSPYLEPASISAESKNAAVAVGRRYAEKARIDAWYTDDGAEFSRVAKHRLTDE